LRCDGDTLSARRFIGGSFFPATANFWGKSLFVAAVDDRGISFRKFARMETGSDLWRPEVGTARLGKALF